MGQFRSLALGLYYLQSIDFSILIILVCLNPIPIKTLFYHTADF